MSSTRDVISPGIFAADASTTIPTTPIAGVSYRDPAAGPISAPDGWPYAERVNSAEFNQLMFQYSTLLGIMDKQGILGWTNLVDYAVPAIVFGSDGEIYTSLQASGPTTSEKDPISEPTYWKKFGVSSQAAIQGSFKNLKGSASGTSAFAPYTMDQIIVEDGSANSVKLNAVSINPSLAASGANGLDTGTSAASTWYAVFVIWNGTTTAGLLSLSATAPTMPSGYTHKARVGWIRSDGTTNKFPLSFIQNGRQVRYKVATGSNVPGIPTIISGLQGNAATPTYVSASVATFVPPTAISIMMGTLNAGGTGALITAAPSNAYGSFQSSTNPPPYVNNIPGGASAQPSMPYNMGLESLAIFVTINTATIGVNCMGWEDML